jgi:hypothetical protein
MSMGDNNMLKLQQEIWFNKLKKIYPIPPDQQDMPKLDMLMSMLALYVGDQVTGALDEVFQSIGSDEEMYHFILYSLLAYLKLNINMNAETFPTSTKSLLMLLKEIPDVRAET